MLIATKNKLTQRHWKTPCRKSILQEKIVGPKLPKNLLLLCHDISLVYGPLYGQNNELVGQAKLY